MAIVAFPPVDKADEHGLVAFGGDLEIPSLLLAYSQGIFPWPIDPSMPMAWFSPNPRGIIEFSNFHYSDSFKKFIKKNPFRVTFNHEFEQVVINCSRVPRKNHVTQTWITPEIIQAYLNFFHAGHAYSVEVWKDEDLVGGLYGVSMGNYISGESMFHLESNASKVALATLITSLLPFGITWIDTQMITPVVQTLGGEYIDRSLFIQKLGSALKGQNLLSIFSKKNINPIPSFSLITKK